MHVGLAKNYHTGFFQRANHGSIVQWHEVFQNPGAARGSNILGVNVVLERDGDAVERASVAPVFSRFPAKLTFRLPGALQRFFLAHGHVGIQPRIQFPDAIEQIAGQLHRRKLAPAEKFSNFSDGRKREWLGVAFQKIFSCRRRFPNVPMFARISPTRNWFSDRTVARLKRPYSTDRPQHPPL